MQENIALVDLFVVVAATAITQLFKLVGDLLEKKRKRSDNSSLKFYPYVITKSISLYLGQHRQRSMHQRRLIKMTESVLKGKLVMYKNVGCPSKEHSQRRWGTGAGNRKHAFWSFLQCYNMLPVNAK